RHGRIGGGAGLVFLFELFLRNFLGPVYVFPGYVRRELETQSLSRDALPGESAFYPAGVHQPRGEINNRSTTVTWIDCRVGLYQPLIFGIIHSNVALDRAKNSAADRTTISNRIAYHDYRLT